MKWLDQFFKIVIEPFVAFLCIALVFITFTEVFFRYVLNHSLFWSEELARYTFIWIVFIGASIGLERGVHVGIDFLLEIIPNNLRKILLTLTYLLMGLLFFFLIYLGYRFVMEIGIVSRAPSLGIRKAWFYAAIPLGGLFLLVSTSNRLISIIKQK
jgi:TRAP-type C4-dicarboxylate transport system permease small subunit